MMRKYIILLIVFAAIEISLALWLTYWRNSFWDSVAAKHTAVFIHDLGTFTVAALAICFVSGISGYLVNLATIAWREKLTAKARLIISNVEIENLPQRIQADTLDYPDLMLTLCYGGTKALMYVVVFGASLVISFSWWYLLILVVYALCSTIATHYIAAPLIKLNYNQQRAEATYRSDLTVSNFNDCVRLMLGIAKKTKRLTYCSQFIGQIGVLVPLLIIAPTYFSTAMTLGTLMRFNSVGSTLLESMNFGVANFGMINRLRSCRLRLKEVGIICY